MQPLAPALSIAASPTLSLDPVGPEAVDSHVHPSPTGRIMQLWASQLSTSSATSRSTRKSDPILSPFQEQEKISLCTGTTIAPLAQAVPCLSLSSTLPSDPFILGLVSRFPPSLPIIPRSAYTIVFYCPGILSVTFFSHYFFLQGRGHYRN